MNRKEEYDLALAENITLKKLIQAKDVLLIQKSQILANVRVSYCQIYRGFCLKNNVEILK